MGLGLSGRSAAHFCAQRGAEVCAVDEEVVPTGRFDDNSLGPGIEVRLGQPFPDPSAFDLVVPSPGVPPERYRKGARRVWGDIELAGRALAIPIIAVTGTNGKSTTVSLIEAMLEAAGLRARAAGNLGTPALTLAGQPLDVGVLEVSSFQLETVESFRPAVAVVLNLSPDHLDRHGSFERYAAAKRRLLEHQGASDVAVLNNDDPVVKSFAAGAGAQILPFSRFGPPAETAGKRSAWLDVGCAVLAQGSRSMRLALDGSGALGAADQDNILAALATVWAFGVDPARAVTALAGFQPLPHRMEQVALIDGVNFVNDSKATNPGAALRALEGTRAPTLWIAGGRDKGLSYRSLADAATGRVRTALLIGEAADQLESCLAGQVPCERLPNLDEAVRRAAELAGAGDVVLLAPACSSFDQFENFEARGECFRRAVQLLAEGMKA
ncbi:MAG: UDP-N-acetylmuramoyl-L-alanine--D-glutamate ligase [Myxococcota bacterium]